MSLIKDLNPFGQGPQALVAHRCDQHRAMVPLNNEGNGLAIYVPERPIKLFPLGSGPNGERMFAECGGCIAEEVEGLYQTVLDQMETIADLLTSHAELRKKLQLQDEFGPAPTFEEWTKQNPG